MTDPDRPMTDHSETHDRPMTDPRQTLTENCQVEEGRAERPGGRQGAARQAPHGRGARRVGQGDQPDLPHQVQGGAVTPVSWASTALSGLRLSAVNSAAETLSLGIGRAPSPFPQGGAL